MLLIIDRLLGRSANTSESDEQPIQTPRGRLDDEIRDIIMSSY
jgi:hypothetical protein